MATQFEINNEYIKEEFKTLNPRQLTVHVENVRFVCFFDSHFNKPHVTPMFKQLDRLHSHSYYELFSVKKGPFSIRLKDELVSFKEGQSILLSPSVLHRSVIDNPATVRYNLCFIIEKSTIKADYDLFSSLTRSLKNGVTVFDNNQICKILENIGNSFATNNNAEFSINIHRLINSFLRENTTNSTTITEHAESRTFKLFHIINNHYMDNITLNDLSKMLFISTKQISRIIKKQRGCTFSKLITQLRMKASADFLATTNLKISEIASRVGYDSLCGFYTAFNKEFGMLPSKYRKVNKQ